MRPGLPRFPRSSTSMYYTEHKPKNKKRGRPGNEAISCNLIFLHALQFSLETAAIRCAFFQPKIQFSRVRVLLRHSVVVASPKRIVINHTQLFTIRFGTSVPKSKSGSCISLFVLEVSLPNRKEKADLPQFVLEQIEKPRTFRFGTCPPNRREDAKAEIGFTIRYRIWS